MNDFKAQSCPELNNQDRKPKCCVTFRLDQIWSTCYRETSVIHQGGAERKINSGVSAKMRQFRKKLSLKNLKRSFSRENALGDEGHGDHFSPDDEDGLDISPLSPTGSEPSLYQTQQTTTTGMSDERNQKGII
ncbi:hypothetical protein BSL78_22945 [Apostichopus japonicus]|uniref:Uncharacterized protein n=1 Tax=Stichopus japonicus TaxID=307972 RepID=A0A2G8JWP6_STIJA|nr:hypothetical protein BSL78_22945 [Apostichopus japonicus]